MARLFNLVHENDEVDFEALKEAVHQSRVDDKAVKKKINDARGLMKEYKLPFELVVSDRRLLKRTRAR